MAEYEGMEVSFRRREKQKEVCLSVFRQQIASQRIATSSDPPKPFKASGGRGYNLIRGASSQGRRLDASAAVNIYRANCSVTSRINSPTRAPCLWRYGGCARVNLERPTCLIPPSGSHSVAEHPKTCRDTFGPHSYAKARRVSVPPLCFFSCVRAGHLRVTYYL
ncbi:hypothetical protein EVAR_63287_1 [Eumeta japonica]|uniref:Uncharacterized protein n=1 Tax=Eumeta variegata TaxID=151549 RepID=A0A4C1ZVE9_EUMVA|nr:hypothetical protein EVAR_63287_1 [Eumeta japonica]